MLTPIQHYNQEDINLFTDFLLNAEVAGKRVFFDAIVREDWKKLFYQVYISETVTASPEGIEEPVYVPGYSGNIAIEGMRGDLCFLYLYFLEVDNFNILNCIDHIPSYTFYNAEIPSKSIEIPKNIKTIFRNAFNGSNITSIVIPNEVEYIGKWCFGNCKDLEKVTIGRNVTSLNEATFFNCRRLKEFIISKNSELNRIEEDIFRESAVNNIKYGGTMKDWKNIKKSVLWNSDSQITTIHCIDGDIKVW